MTALTTDSKPTMTPNAALNVLRRAVGDALTARARFARAQIDAAACGTSSDWREYRDAEAADSLAVDAVDDALAAVAAAVAALAAQGRE